MSEKTTDMISRRLHELWADATAAALAIEHDLSNLKEHAQASLQHWLANPEVVRSLFNGLRDVKPVLAVHGFAVVTKHADVLEVLSHDEDFTVQQIYAAKMERTSGSFFLGMDRGPQYEREHRLLRMATDPVGDVARIRDTVRTQAEKLIEAAKPAGRIDAV